MAPELMLFVDRIVSLMILTGVVVTFLILVHKIYARTSNSTFNVWNAAWIKCNESQRLFEEEKALLLQTVVSQEQSLAGLAGQVGQQSATDAQALEVFAEKLKTDAVRVINAAVRGRPQPGQANVRPAPTAAGG